MCSIQRMSDGLYGWQWVSFTAPLFSRNALLNAATIHAFTVLDIRLRIQVLTRNASSIENDTVITIGDQHARAQSRAYVSRIAIMCSSFLYVIDDYD